MSTRPTLARRLGTTDAVVIGLGSMIGAGVFAAFAPAAQAAGTWLLVGLAVAALVAYANATSSAQLAAQYPTSGGTYVYGRERLGPWEGFAAGWAFVIGKTASCAAMALTFAAYAAPPGWERPTAAAAVVALAAVNYHGVTKTAGLTRVIVTIVLLSLGAVVLAGLLGGDPEWSRVLPAGAPGAGSGLVGAGTDGLKAVPGYGVLQSAGLLFFAFAGYARIATLGEEVREPERVIPRAVVLALSTVLVIYLVVGVIVLGVLGHEGAAGSAAPVAEAASVVWGEWWSWVIRVVAGLAALGALLNLVLGISRTALAMARDRHLPRPMAVVAGPHSVPRVAELVVGTAVLVAVLLADLRGAIGFSSFGVLLYYAVANASAWTLREEWPLGRVVPVVGLVGCLVLAVTLPLGSVVGGGALVLAGALVYLVRGRQGSGRPVG